jgi:ribose transport system substrate-binding protein
VPCITQPKGNPLKKISVLIALGAAAVLALTGCSTSPGSSTASGGDKTQTVGATFSDLSNPVWAELVKEAKSYGNTKGISVTYVDAQNSSATQVTQIENFIQQGVDAIIVCAVDAKALTAVTKEAQAKGIKVIGYTQVLKNVDAQLLVDSYKTGYANGESAAKWINANYSKEPVVEWGLMDLPQYPEIIERAQGIKDAIAKLAPNSKLVATAPALTASDGVTNAENFLQANPKMKVIATIGGGGAGGGIEGVKSAGIKDFAKFGLFGIDATQPELKDIAAGGPEKSTISLGGGKAHGDILINMTLDLLNGKKVEKDQFMPITVVDKSNVAKFLK